MQQNDLIKQQKLDKLITTKLKLKYMKEIDYISLRSKEKEQKLGAQWLALEFDSTSSTNLPKFSPKKH